MVIDHMETGVITVTVDRVEVRPFTRVIWRKGAPEKYRVALERAPSICSKAEYETVRRGFRECDAFHLHSRTWSDEFLKLTRDGLVYLPILKAASVSGFAHRFYEPKDEEFMLYGVISRNIRSARAFREAHKRSDHDRIGFLLGYPECCRSFFLATFPGGELDPIWMAGSGGLRPELNQFLRYFGPRIIPFFPCSYSCEEALGVAEIFLNIMREIDRRNADLILDLLSMPAYWSMNKSIIQVTHLLFTGICNGYSRPEKVDFFWLGREEWISEYPVLGRWMRSELELMGEDWPFV